MSLLSKILTVLLGVMIICTPVITGKAGDNAICRGIKITVADSSRHHFVTDNDILNIIRSQGIRITGVRMADIPLSATEEAVKTMKELKVAEVYLSPDNILHVYADQREPVMRVVASYGGDFFVDDEGIIMRRHNLYTPHLHILEADMVFNPDQMTGQCIFDSDKAGNLADAFKLINYIRKDNFWDSMIDHLIMTRDGKITMVPSVGSHTVRLGRIDNYMEKLDNLRVFYREAMPVAGWNRYKVIDIEFHGQVVCQRR